MIVVIILLSLFSLLFFGYPLLAWVLSKVRNKPVKRRKIFPFVSIIIPCYNEEKVIENKIQNTLSLEYPKSKYEIIVVDSGSTDGTKDILEKHGSLNHIRLVRQSRRLGKASAINEGLAIAVGEIVVLTDADAFLNAKSLEYLIENFADESVGAGVGNMILGGNGILSKMNSVFYQYFRQNIREWESKIDSVSFFSGEFLAFRKCLIEKVDENAVSDDLSILFEARKKGLRCICDERAYVFENDIETLWGQVNHKRRTFVGTLQVFVKNLYVLFNPKYGFFGMFIAPSYIVRMLSYPFFILTLSIFLVLYVPWILLFVLMLLFLITIVSKRAILALLYGVVVQIASFLGIVDYLTGNYTVLWSKKGK